MKAKTLRRRYRREAAVMLVLLRIALRLVPLRRLVAWAARPPRRIARFRDDEIGWVAWAVEAVGAKRRAAALERALATQCMLRRRGIAARLCLGVGREGGSLLPHAWIEVGGKVVLGGDSAARAVRMLGGGPA